MTVLPDTIRRLIVVAQNQLLASRLQRLFPANLAAEATFQVVYLQTANFNNLQVQDEVDWASIEMAFVVVDSDTIDASLSAIRNLRNRNEQMPIVVEAPAATCHVPELCEQLAGVNGWLLRTTPWADAELRQWVNSLSVSPKSITESDSQASPPLRSSPRKWGERQAQLERFHKLEALSSLSGGVAHEFNNLLQAIQGYTQFALDALPTNGASRGDMQQVLEVTRRAADLTGKLLDFSRRRPLHVRAVQLNPLIARTLRQFASLEARGITLELALDQTVDTVVADSEMLEIVVRQLCANACEAMPHGGALKVQTRNVVISDGSFEQGNDIHLANGRYLMLAVSDTGCGMSPLVQQHLFEPFFSTKEVGQGAGMGLATVHGIVMQHQGLIDFESTLGNGSSFRILLPTIPQSARAPSFASEEMRCVLVVDDDPVVRDVAVRILQKGGYRTFAADDGEDALQQFNEHHDEISVVLLDAVMPRLSGRQVYDEIHRQADDVEVVFCTGHDPRLESLNLPWHEGVSFVSKPFQTRTLLGAINLAFDARSRRLGLLWPADVEST